MLRIRTMYLVGLQGGGTMSFTSKSGTSYIEYSIVGSIRPIFYKSPDNSQFTEWDGSRITINNGETVYVRGDARKVSASSPSNVQFTISGEVESDFQAAGYTALYTGANVPDASIGVDGDIYIII